MTTRFFALFAFLFIALPLAMTQEGVIYLTNPSFEDLPQHSRTPIGWTDCGFPGESAPDIQPGQFGVTKAAQNGNTYLGLVVREKETWEGVAQRMSRPMEKDKCYEFSIFLCRAEFYLSPTQPNTLDSSNFITPAKLRIYGGFGPCDKQYLLAETKEIISHRWLEYKFKLEPIANYTHITLEAFYRTPVLFPYNGNVLVDNLSEIKPIPCDKPLEDKPVAEAPTQAQTPPAATPKPPVTTPKPPAATPKPNHSPTQAGAPATSPTKPAGAESSSIAELRSADLREGQTIRIDRLYFKTDSAVIAPTAYPVLEDLYTFMSKNQDVVVEIGGHTNSLPPHEYCDRLSASRAKAVYDYLIQKGIPAARLQYKGYGKRQPVDTNATVDGRKNNQRVEVKILKLNSRG
jgi:outer membrane protein OmpA-like peptidoglycan-associated protein